MSSCSAFVRAVPAWNSFACTTVLTQSELLLHVVRLHLLLFSLCQSCSCLEFVCLHYCSACVRTVPAWNSSASTTVQPVSGLFLPGIRLLALLFSLCQDCSCLETVCLPYCSAWLPRSPRCFHPNPSFSDQNAACLRLLPCCHSTVCSFMPVSLSLQYSLMVGFGASLFRDIQCHFTL